MAAISQLALMLFVIAVTAKFTGAQLLDFEMMNSEYAVFSVREVIENVIVFSVDTRYALKNEEGGRIGYVNRKYLPGIIATPQKISGNSVLQYCCASSPEPSSQAFYFRELTIQILGNGVLEHLPKKLLVKFSDASGKKVIQVDMDVYNQSIQPDLPFINEPIASFPRNLNEGYTLYVSWMEDVLRTAKFYNSQNMSGLHIEYYSAEEFAVEEDVFNGLY